MDKKINESIRTKLDENKKLSARCCQRIWQFFDCIIRRLKNNLESKIERKRENAVEDKLRGDGWIKYRHARE